MRIIYMVGRTTFIEINEQLPTKNESKRTTYWKNILKTCVDFIFGVKVICIVET